MMIGLTSLRKAGWLLLAGLISLPTLAQQYIMPAQIGSTIEQQTSELQQYLNNPPASANLDDWTKYAMLAVIKTSNPDGTANPEHFKQAESIVAEAEALFPQDPEIMAIKGSFTCITAAAPGLGGMEALAIANTGFRILDQAVLKNKYDLGARLQRAISLQSSPAFLGKGKRAISDLRFLLKRIPNAPENTELQGMLMVLLAETYLSQKAPEQAQQMLQQASVLKAGIWSDKAKDLLKQGVSS